MSWLRDCIHARGLKVGEFCRLAQSHAGWTSRSKNPRTLENHIRLYEDRENLKLFTKRRYLYEICGQILAIGPDEVRRLDAVHRSGGDGRSIILNDVPGASFSINDKDPLPALWPTACREPRGWGQDWWLAPAGSGRTLLGQALMMKGAVAAVHVLTRVDQVDKVLASGAPRLVEIPDPAVAMKVAPRLAGCGSILVATPCLPHPEEAPHDFEPGRLQWTPAPLGSWTIHRMNLDRWQIEGLLDWMGGVTPDAELRATHDEARATLLRLFDSGYFDPEVLGDLISAYGILRQVGAGPFAAALDGGGELSRIHELVQMYLEARLALYDGLDENEPLGVWLGWLAQERSGFGVLLAMAGASFERREMVFTPVTAEHWAEPLRGFPGPDGPLGEDADEVVRTLAHAGMLQAVGHGQLVLRPRWLIGAVQHVAAARLLEQPESSSWAWALQPSGVRLAFTVLCQEYLAGRFGSVGAALELADDADRSGDASALGIAMAAVGLVARALGMAVLHGAEPPLELVREVYRRELAWRWEPPDTDLPGPQVRFAGLVGVHARTQDAGDVAVHLVLPSLVGRLDQACWLAGILGLASCLPDAGQISDDQLLAPFSSTVPSWTDHHRGRFGRVAGYLALLVTHGGVEQALFEVAIHRLGRLLVERAGHCTYVLATSRPGERPCVHPLFWTSMFVSIAARGRARPSLRHLELMVLPDVDLYPPLDAVLREAERAVVVESRIVPSLLRLWRHAHPELFPALLERRLLRGEMAFIEHLSVKDLDGPLGDALLRAGRIGRQVYDALAVEQWTALVDRARAVEVPVDWGQLCERIPAGALPALLEHGLLDRCGLAGSSVLWRRFPPDLVLWCRQQIDAGAPLEGLLPVLSVAPPARLAQLAARIQGRLAPMGPMHPALPRLTSVVLTAVDRRPAGWLELQVLLMGLIEIGRGVGVNATPAAVRRVSSEQPSPLPLGRVIEVESGRAITVALAQPGVGDRGVLVAASETGFSPLGARLRLEAPVGEDHVLAPLVEAMRASESGPLLCSVPSLPGIVDRPMVILQTDRGAWFGRAFPRGIEPWSGELGRHYRRMILATAELAGRISDVEPALTLAHPVGHGWPQGLVEAVVESFGELVAGDGWVPDEVLIDGCCVARDGAGFVDTLDRVRPSRSTVAFALEPVAWSELGIELDEGLAGVELFRVRKG
jgi:hypothetical protein